MSLHDPPKQPCQEFEDAIDGVFMLGMPLPRFNRLLPQRVVRLLERTQLCGDSLLLAADGVDTLHDGSYINSLILALTVLRWRGLKQT